MPAPDDHAAALARLAGLLADPTRAAMCLALLDHRAWTAGELARHTGVAPSTATEHLTRLVQGGLLTQHHQGRHRYVRLADAATAHLVESLAARAAPGPAAAPARTLRQDRATGALARARTCYDHLAGHLGCAITDAMTRTGLLDQDTGFALTQTGLAWFDEHGIALPKSGRRPLARACLDWTERRPHLAGTAGAALCTWVLDSGWCVRVGSGRALQTTDSGRTALQQLWGVHTPA
ncbi:helix-turn-helix transcriptional regulator [Nocardiopsis sp. YSL2]|uniref:ArsR/SmtB family transcription factor n=1 Tax=Nocardiopsis sp. YSL2 TaxID=2939492 RepID=UPI0026F46053|nr:winged helix-turn-helix domain-containing protein [Nocardiopsis sp. YSL2]